VASVISRKFGAVKSVKFTVRTLVQQHP
jgi:hypothetical protein